MDGDDKVNILLVDDQPAKLLTYEAVLKELGENFLVANSARQAFDHLLRTDVAVVLVDVYMPDLDGFELARMIREHPRFQQTAIIFISAVLLTDLDFLRGYEVGAVDYVPVPVVPEILRAKVKIFSELYRKSRQLERLNHELEQRVAERTAALEASTEELRHKEERLQLAFDAAHMGWCDCDLDTGQVRWSSRLAEMIGLPVDSEGGSFVDFLNHVAPEDREKFLALVQGGSNGAGSQGGELRFSRPDGSIRWSFAAGQLIRQENPRPMRFTGVFLDITERKKAEEQQTLLMREVDHRAKNLLAVVQSMLNLSKAETTAEFITAVSGRIKALSLAHTLLSESRWQGVELERLVEEETAPFGGHQVPRIRFEGPPVSLQPAAAQCLAVTLHELITNAAKYGALSSTAGVVTLGVGAGRGRAGAPLGGTGRPARLPARAPRLRDQGDDGQHRAAAGRTADPRIGGPTGCASSFRSPRRASSPSIARRRQAGPPSRAPGCFPRPLPQARGFSSWRTRR